MMCPVGRYTYTLNDFCNVTVEAVDDDADFDVPVDIFAIGFEEIVDLNAGNIVSARFIICVTIYLPSNLH